jgi:hypothetical protein
LVASEVTRTEEKQWPSCNTNLKKPNSGPVLM